MISTDNNSIVITSRTFHWWPFSFDVHFPGHWRGFVEQDNIILTDSDIIVSYSKDGKGEFSLPITDLEYCIHKKTFFRFMGNTKVSVGVGEQDNLPWKDGNVSFYIDFGEISAFIDALKTKKPLCFSQETIMLEERIPWYRIDKLLSGNRNILWMNDKHILSSESIKRGWCVKTNKIKYFYTRGIINNNLYIGSEKRIRFSNVTNEDVRTARQYIKLHGGNIAEDATESYSDSWTPNVLFSPSLWFTHSSIGFTDKGIIYHQKTFKTNDDIFLPFDKINVATYNSKWYWLFTKKITIYGEQNITPKKRFSKVSVDIIKHKLEAARVKKIEGSTYTPSYHSSWFGILLSIFTLSLYHWLVVTLTIFQKRNTLVIDKNRIVWDGKIYYFTPSQVRREVWKKLTTLVVGVKDIEDIVYIKKHWYHLWGHLFIWANPDNIRRIDGEAGENQKSVDYDLEIKKIWSWDVRNAILILKKSGFESDGKKHELYTEWCKHFLFK